jgi:hypothetical protein
MLLRDEQADRRMAEAPSLLAYLPRILWYPLSGHGPGALLLFTVLLWLGVQSVFGMALLAIATPWVFHYAEGVIEQTAHGRATPPVFGGDMIFLGSNATALRPLIGVGLIAGAYALVVAGGHGTAAQASVLVAGAFLFPAFMLVLTVENSVLAALNPLQVAPAIIAIGPAYLAVCMILSAAAVTALFAASQTALFVALFVAIYLWLMSFHLLGYIAYHRADRLGLRVKVAAPTDESRRFEEQAMRLAAVLAKIDAALAHQDLDAAGAALYAEPGGPADLRLFHEELFEQVQVATRRRPELIHAQGQRLIALLIREKRLARALDIAETCFDAHHDFATAEPAHAVVLAEAALQAKRDGVFARLTRDAAQRYGNDPAAVSLAFLTARFCCERERDDARAREILAPLLQHTAHPQHRQIAAYARAITGK